MGVTSEIRLQASVLPILSCFLLLTRCDKIQLPYGEAHWQGTESDVQLTANEEPRTSVSTDHEKENSANNH